MWSDVPDLACVQLLRAVARAGGRLSALQLAEYAAGFDGPPEVQAESVRRVADCCTERGVLAGPGDLDFVTLTSEGRAYIGERVPPTGRAG